MGILVDNFAGGGGASTGIEAALGRDVNIAVDHSPQAIAMHTANHPRARHFMEDVWKVDPIEAAGGEPVDLAWFSPDCTHFSRAKGGKPRSGKRRALAWVVIRWARTVRPRVIVLENVEEFLTWGPLDADGNPCKRRAGRTFRAWCGKLRAQGYRVEWRSLVAADFGAPTTRRRLFLIARCDGQPIVWPTPTHGRGRAKPWRTAAEIIDWSVPCPSIFGRKKPLAEATLARIAAGLRRYVLESPTPFVVPLTHHGQRRIHPLDEPLPTVTAANRGELALVAPTLIQTGYGEREGQAPRALDLAKPLGTVVSTQKHGAVVAFLAKHYGTSHGGPHPGVAVDVPIGTITARDHHSVVTARDHHSVVTARDHHSVVTAQLSLPLDRPAAGTDRRAEVRAFLVAYYGNEKEGQPLQLPLRTVPTRDRFGLVVVDGVDYEIADIGMRMLTPRELFRAQGFPDDYRLDAPFEGRALNKTEQIELAGNSVCPPIAEAIVRANCGRSAVTSEVA